MMKFSHFEFDPERDRLGEGPQSEVFRATDTRLGRTVALKILRPHVEFDPAAKERFEREAKHTSNLAHPNIATVYDYGQDRGTSYIVMEFLEGRTLDQIVKDRPLGYEEGMRIATQVTSAMGLVHERGLIHRDLKPANIMVQEDSTVKLLDFGICRSTQESSITQNGMLVGTVLYMSPEQVLGDELDSRTDVWALGAVFYLAFTGELAFPGRSVPEVCMAILEAKPKPPREIRTGFPPALSEFLLKCLERDRDKRYANGNEMHGALLAVAEGMRMQTESEQPTTIRGRVLIPPIAVVDDGRSDFAGGLRKDLASELERSTKLEVALLETDELPAECENAFVVRSKLDLEDGRATLTYVLERLEQNGKNSRNTTTELFRESIEHTDTDEWGLQGKLVGSLARSVRKKLSEVALLDHGGRTSCCTAGRRAT
ncbi:MAG: serine/threonine-protein kinase [Planctomycetota bacterium]|nr:serine/threonine-protein kinase [Planctomycetota bacterium]